MIKLHKPLSAFLVGRPRKAISNCACNALRGLYRMHKDQRLVQYMIETVLYFPSLALFLAVRVSVDHWASMYFEVGDTPGS